MHTLIHYLPHLRETHLFGEVVQIECSAHIVALPCHFFVSHIVVVFETVALLTNEKRTQKRQKCKDQEYGVNRNNQSAYCNNFYCYPNNIKYVIHYRIGSVRRFARSFYVCIEKCRTFKTSKISFNRFLLKQILNICFYLWILSLKITARYTFEKHIQNRVSKHASKSN